MRNLLQSALIALLALVMAAPAAQATRQRSGGAAPGWGVRKNAVNRPTSRLIDPSERHSMSTLTQATSPKTARQVQLRVKGRNLTLGGIMVWHDDWYNDGATVNAGPVSYTTPETADYKPLTAADKTWMDVYAATPVGDTYYVISGAKYGTDSENAYFGSFSLNNWSGSLRRYGIDWSSVASDLAYDPVSGEIYGVFVDNVGQEADNDFHYLGTISVTGTAYDIGYSDRPIVAIAFDDNGNLYGINLYGGFVLINKENATNQVLMWPSDSGAPYPADGECNSMTYDSASGHFFWAATYEESEGVYPDRHKVIKSALYEIDPVARTLTKVMDMPGNASIAGLYVISSELPGTAPQQATDINVAFAALGDLTGTLSFTAPSLDVNGNALTGTLTAVINAAGTELTREGIAPGSVVEVTDLTFAEGVQRVTITIETDDAQGDAAVYTFYAGEDLPGQPQNVTLAATDDNVPLLTWEPAAVGKNGGRYDTDAVTYTITRFPDEETVATGVTATTFTDADYEPSLKPIYYTVTAVTGKGKSDPAQSNPMTYGSDMGYTVPFTEGFDDVESFERWTVINVNGGATWQYDPSESYRNVYYQYDANKLPGDDWFISPKIKLLAGTKYKVSFFARVFSSRYAESFKVCLGTAPTVEGMTTVIADYPSFNNGPGVTDSHYVTVEADGDYYLGFYCYSEPDKYRLCIDNIAMEVVDGNVPAAVSDLTVTAGELGAMEATVAFTAPTTNSDGGLLATLTAINVYRDTETEPIHTFENPVKGAELTWIDNSMTTAGTYTYRVIAANELGDGVEARESAFVGVDAPGAVENLRMEETAEGIVLTWDAPAAGRNGGYYDPANVQYSVWNWLAIDLLASKISATTFTDTSVNMNEQNFVDYVVYTYAGDAAGTWAEVMGVVGKPYDAPFRETFAMNPNDGEPDMDNYPWLSEANHNMNVGIALQTAGEYPAALDQGNDGGMAVFHSRGEIAGGVLTLSSPRINVATVDKPELSFYMYHSHDEAVTTAETLSVRVSVDGGEWQDVDGATWARDNGNTGWARHTLSLEDYKDAAYVRLAFVATIDGTLEEGLDIYLDTIVIDTEAGLPGDVNGDGVVNATDIAIIVNIIAGIEDSEDYDGRADLNDDGVINATDLAIAVNIIAGLTAE